MFPFAGILVIGHSSPEKSFLPPVLRRISTDPGLPVPPSWCTWHVWQRVKYPKCSPKRNHTCTYTYINWSCLRNKHVKYVYIYIYICLNIYIYIQNIQVDCDEYITTADTTRALALSQTIKTCIFLYVLHLYLLYNITGHHTYKCNLIVLSIKQLSRSVWP